MSDNAKSLGTTTKYASKYRLLDTAQMIMDHDNHRVCMCCSAPVPDQTIEIRTDEDNQHASYAGTIKCGSVWACPICSSRIAEERRLELMRGVHEAKRRGWLVVMMTNTLSHHKRQSLREVRNMFNAAWRKFTSGRWKQDLYEEYAIQGSVRAWELTYGDNGWHVHTHTLLFMDAAFVPENLEAYMSERWAHCVAGQGGKVSLEHGLKLSTHSGRIDEYLAKFGRLPADTSAAGEWDEAAELAHAHRKQARSNVGRTPFQLLADAGTGDRESARLFREYVLASKNQRQLVWSNGLREDLLADEVDVSDEEIADEVDTVTIATIGLDVWREVCQQRVRGELLDMALADVGELHMTLQRLAEDSESERGGVTIRTTVRDYKIVVRWKDNAWQVAAWHKQSNRATPNFRSTGKSEMEAYFLAVMYANAKVQEIVDLKNDNV